MSRRSGNDWTALLGGIAQLAVAGGVAYVVVKAREAFIEQLLTQPTEEAVQLLIRDVPQMDTDTWDTFSRHLHRQAEVNNYALNLLQFAVDVHRISLSIEQLLTNSLYHARAVLENTAQDMDDATWSIFEYILSEKAKANLTTRTLLNHAINIRNFTAPEERFRAGIKEALEDNIITSEEATELEKLRRDLHISPEVARTILLKVKATKQMQQDDKPRFYLSPPE